MKNILLILVLLFSRRTLRKAQRQNKPIGCDGRCDISGSGGIMVCHRCGWDDYD